MMVINKENIEEYLLLLVDGELSAADEMEVMTFIENHKEYQVLLDQYMETKLEPEDIVFENKESLLKPEENIIPFKKRRTVLYAAAGVAAVLLAGTVFKLMMKQESIAPTVAAIQTAPKVNVDSSAKSMATIAAKMNTVKQATSLSSSSLVKVPSVMVKKNVVAPVASLATNTAPSSYKRIIAKPVQPLSTKGLETAAIVDEAKINEAALSTVALSFDEDVTIKSNGMLPDASRLEGLNDLISQVETLKDKIADKSKIFKNMTVAIRLGGKEFTIGK